MTCACDSCVPQVTGAIWPSRQPANVVSSRPVWVASNNIVKETWGYRLASSHTCIDVHTQPLPSTQTHMSSLYPYSQPPGKKTGWGRLLKTVQILLHSFWIKMFSTNYKCPCKMVLLLPLHYKCQGRTKFIDLYSVYGPVPWKAPRKYLKAGCKERKDEE